jgi:hypothetical protein
MALKDPPEEPSLPEGQGRRAGAHAHNLGFDRQETRHVLSFMLIFLGAVLFFGSIVITSISQLPIAVVYLGTGICVAMVILGAVIAAIRRPSTLPQSASDPFDRTGFSQTLSELSKNFAVLRSQTFIGFVLAGVTMLLGALVIMAGAFGQVFGLAQQGVNLATVSGIVSEFVSGTAILFYKLSFDRLNVTSEQLLRATMVMSALTRAEALQGDSGTELTIELIRAMVRSPSSSRP